MKLYRSDCDRDVELFAASKSAAVAGRRFPRSHAILGLSLLVLAGCTSNKSLPQKTSATVSKELASTIHTKAQSMPTAKQVQASFASSLVARHSSTCVDVPGGSSVEGLGLIIWQCHGGENQNFIFTPDSEGFFRIQNVQTRLCLDAGSGAVTSGSPIRQGACTSVDSQRFKLSATDSGAFMLSTFDPAGCLDVYGGRATDGTSVTSYACHGGWNQQFAISGYITLPLGPSPTPAPAPTPPPLPSPTHDIALVLPSTSPDAPKIFNASSSALAGDLISLQGANLTGAQIVLEGKTAAQDRFLSAVNRAGSTQLTVQILSDVNGAIIIRLENSFGTSGSVRLNAAVPFGLDALETAPSGALRILGKNLFVPGSSPRVEIAGVNALIDLGQSDENVLVVTVPATIPPQLAASIVVNNGNGSGPTQLDRSLRVVAGSGDPLGLGVGWAAGFSDLAARTVNAAAACNGTSDDSTAIQSAIESAFALGGAVVKIPSGNCRLGRSITLRSGVVLKGAGKDATTISYETNYAVSAENLDLVGLQDLTLRNVGAPESPLWKSNTRSFWMRVKFDKGVSRQIYVSGNTNMVVTESEFYQPGTINGQNPYIFSGTSGLVFVKNLTTFGFGAPDFGHVHNAYFADNRFTRDARSQFDATIVTTHSFVIGFASSILVTNNIFDVANGPITNKVRNDGETILTEGGGDARTENLGQVTGATANTVRDSNNLLNVHPFGDGIPHNYGIAIVDGKGAGQTRRVTAYQNRVMTVDRNWDLIPDASSKYATFVWGLEKSVIRRNQLSQNPRGIWLYHTAVRDVDIVQNRITEGGGIYLRTYQNVDQKLFMPHFNIRIVGNDVSNTTGNWMSHINVVFVNSDAKAFGLSSVGIEIRDNKLTANRLNVESGYEEYAGTEGYMNMMRFEN